MRSRRGGFTLIEVMVAVGIVTMGAVGILALQKAALRGNIEARQITTATQITRTWIERIRRDALRWNTNVAGGTAQTTHLQHLPATLDPGEWRQPVPNVLAGEYPGFNWQGRDEATPAAVRYCVNMRLSWLQMNRSARVEVRTYWWRTSPGADVAVFQGCGDPAAVTNALGNLATGGLRAVQAATIVRWQPLQ
jgi:type IV pilus assembly protein PilV